MHSTRLKGWPRHETFQFCHAHVGSILENHVLAHHLDGRLDFSAENRKRRMISSVISAPSGHVR